MTTKIVNVVEDPETGDLMLDLGIELCAELGWQEGDTLDCIELCAELGWQEGDTLDWQDNKDGSWMIRKISPSQT